MHHNIGLKRGAGIPTGGIVRLVWVNHQSGSTSAYCLGFGTQWSFWSALLALFLSFLLIKLISHVRSIYNGILNPLYLWHHGNSQVSEVSNLDPHLHSQPNIP